MDGLNRARRPLRNELKQLLEELGVMRKGPIDKEAVRVHYRLIQASYEKLMEFDQKAEHLLVEEHATEEQQDAEFARTREIRLSVETLRVKMDSLFSVPSPTEGSVSGLIVAGEVEGMGLQLPKFQFKKFGGGRLDWLGFWAQFKKVDQNKKLDGSDKFGYLLMALEEGSEPYELVIGFPQTNEGYLEAISELKQSYGNEDILLQVYVRELLKLVISNADKRDKMPFSNLCRKVNSHLQALKTLKLASADPDTWLYPLVESCLPEEIQLAWQRSGLINADGSQMMPPKTRLNLMMEFVGKEVNIRKNMGLAREGFQELITTQNTCPMKRSAQESAEYGAKTFVKRQRHESTPTLTGFQNVDAASVCIFCNKKGHVGADCFAANKMMYEERMKIVKVQKR